MRKFRNNLHLSTSTGFSEVFVSFCRTGVTLGVTLGVTVGRGEPGACSSVRKVVDGDFGDGVGIGIGVRIGSGSGSGVGSGVDVGDDDDDGVVFPVMSSTFKTKALPDILKNPFFANSNLHRDGSF